MDAIISTHGFWIGRLELTYLSAFIVGLFSTLHCIGMCGGIIGALTFSLPEPIRNNRWRLFPYVSAYNLGRIATYTVAGGFAGALGDSFLLIDSRGHLLLQLLASGLMIAIGLYLAGWFPAFAHLERIGNPLWRRLQPLGQRLLPVRSPLHAFGFGVIWGWLPCGLVYTSVLWATTTHDAVQGMGLMLAFGAGTLPTVMTAGILTGWFVRLSNRAFLRPLVGSGIIVLAIVTGYLAFAHTTH